MKRTLLASALGATVLFAPFAAQAQTKLDPNALATSNAALGGGTSAASVSPVSAATTPYGTSAAATTGTDNAGNYSGDYNGQNQGTGFLGFSVSHTGGGSAGSFIGSSGNAGYNINSPNGNSFGVYANGASDATVNVSRSFASPLQYTGDSFSIQLRTDFNNSSSGQTLTYKIGGETLTLNNAGYTLTGGTVVNGLTQNDYILNATYTVGANNTYQFTVNGNNPSTDMATATGTYTQAVNQFQIIGVNLPNDQFFNNLSITNNSAPAPTPEPGGIVPLMMGAFALGGLIVKRRRAMTVL